MWNDYFNGNCNIYSIDIDPRCKTMEQKYSNIHIYIGDQADKNFLNEFILQVPQLDIIIDDDGGHIMNQQITSFEMLFPHVKLDGIYLVEDLHTSYWSEYGGGYKREGTFIDLAKNIIDQINAFHSREP